MAWSRAGKQQGGKRQNPASAYIGKQARSAQATQRSALAKVAAIVLDQAADPEAFAWHKLTYSDVVRLREVLVAGFAPATVNRILAAVRGTLREAWAAELLDPDQRDRLLYGLKNVRGGRLQRGRVLAKGEIAAVIDACLVDPSAAGARDAAIVALMVGAGLRRGEIAALDPIDVHLAVASVRVLGKGNVEREAPLIAPVLERMKTWAARRGKIRGGLFVPVSRYGRMRSGRLGPSGVWRLVQKRARQAGIQHMTPHDCRRTATTMMLDAGADLAVVQRLVGHRNVATTIRYDRRGLAAERRAAELVAGLLGTGGQR